MNLLRNLKNSENAPYDGKGYSFFNIAITLYNFSYFNLALHSWEHALKYFIGNDGQYGESSCYGSVGAIYSDFGDYAKAIEYQKKSLVIDKEIRDRAGESHCYINLGVAYHNLG